MRNWLHKKVGTFTATLTPTCLVWNIRTVKKIRTILIDDEQNSIRLLKHYLVEECPQVEIIGAYTDSQLGLEAVLSDKPELVFLDIQMPHLNGFELLDRCSSPLPFRLIFTTAYDQYAVKAIRYSAMDYLLKPFSSEELVESVHRVTHLPRPDERQMDILRQFNPNLDLQNLPSKITLSTSEGLIFLKIDNIIHCDSDGAYTKIFSTDESPILVSKPIKEIQELLSHPQFYRVHHSFLINMHFVKRYIRSEGSEVIMADGSKIPVSRSKKQEFLAFITAL